MENQERKPRRRRRRRPQEGSQGGPQDHVEIIPLGGMGEIGKNITVFRFRDEIFVLDGGRLVEQGRHDQLMAARGSYAGLVRAQTEGRIAARPGLEAPGSGLVGRR